MTDLINGLSQVSMTAAIANSQTAGLPKIPSELLKLVQIGTLATLKITPQQNNIWQVVLQTETQEISLPINEQTAQQISNGQPVEIPVRIGTGGQLTEVKTPQVFEKAEVFQVTEHPALQSIEVAPLKVAEFVKQTLDNLKAPENIKQELVADIKLLEVSIQNIGKPQSNENVLLRPIYEILQQAVQENANIPEIKTQLTELITQLVGSKIDGKITDNIKDLTVIKTPLGETFFESKIKLPPEENVVLNIKGIPVDYQEELKVLDSLLKVIFPKKVSHIKTDVIASQPQLRSLAQVTSMLPENLFNEVALKLPLASDNLFQNMFNFYQGATKNSVTKWLGTEIVKEIATEFSDGNRVLQELQNFVSSTLKETPTWRMVEMPLFDGTQFSFVKIAVKKDAQNKNQEAQQQNSGTRFVVETNFSKLGSFQFDGFSNAAKRNLDLIIRTSAAQEDDFCANIINLFKKTLYNLDYTGTIKINRQETFIRLTEDNNIKQGIYV